MPAVIALLDRLGRAIDQAPDLPTAHETAASYRAHGITLYVEGDRPAPPAVAYVWLSRWEIATYDDLAAITAPILTLRHAA